MPYALTIELDDETLQTLDRLAEQTDRSRAALIEEVVRDYLAVEAAQLAEIAEAIAEADRGEFVSQEEIERILKVRPAGVRVVWTPAASRDAEAAGEFIALDNRDAAMRVMHRIRERAWALADNPFIGRPGRAHGTRELVVSGTSYIIVYRVIEDRVDILKVLHGAQRWPARF